MKNHNIKLFSLFILILIFGASLIISLHYATNSFAGIQDQGYDFLKTVINEREKSFTAFFLQILSIILFSVSSFIFFVLFFGTLNALAFNRPDYLKMAVRWELYKLYHSFFPFGIVNLIIIALIALSIIFFNTLVSLSGISLGFFAFISVFMVLNLIFFYFSTAILGICRIIKLSLTSNFMYNSIYGKNNDPNN